MPESGATPVPKGSIRVAERFHARSPGPEPSDSRRSFWSHIHGAVATMVTRSYYACSMRTSTACRTARCVRGETADQLSHGEASLGVGAGCVMCGWGGAGARAWRWRCPQHMHATWDLGEATPRRPRVPHIVSKAVLHYHENKNGNASQNTALSLYPPSCPPASAASWLGRSTRRKRLRTALGERPGSNAAIAAHFCPRRSTWLVRT